MNKHKGSSLDDHIMEKLDEVEQWHEEANAKYASLQSQADQLAEALGKTDYWMPDGYEICDQDWSMNERLVKDNEFISNVRKSYREFKEKEDEQGTNGTKD